MGLLKGEPARDTQIYKACFLLWVYRSQCTSLTSSPLVQFRLSTYRQWSCSVMGWRKATSRCWVELRSCWIKRDISANIWYGEAWISVFNIHHSKYVPLLVDIPNRSLQSSLQLLCRRLIWCFYLVYNWNVKYNCKDAKHVAWNENKEIMHRRQRHILWDTNWDQKKQ